MPGGRPSKFKPEFVEQAQKLCALGATDFEIADFFGIHTATLYRWKEAYPQFCDALKTGKDVSDERVERSLYHRATGYKYEAVKIFQHQGEVIEAPYVEHVPPDVTAAIFWLKNRRPAQWRDKQDIEHGGSVQFEEIRRTVINGGS